MVARRSLLESIQALLERTYRMDSGVGEPGRFVIGDAGYRQLYTGSVALGSPHDDGARMLVRETAEGLRACIYYPDALIERLERYPPQHGLHERNVDAFAALVEELDHLLLLAERTRHMREVSLFELELHANVSKHLVLSRFLAGQRRRLGQDRRAWLRHHLFAKAEYCDTDPRVRERYRRARRDAVKFLDGQQGRRPAQRLELLRRFHHEGASGKLRLIERLNRAG